MRAAWYLAGTLIALAGCAPGVRPLARSPPRTAMPQVPSSPTPVTWRFSWTYTDDTFNATGDGVLRIAPPNRARLDFFLKNGMSGGYAVLIDDTLHVPGPDMARRFLP